MTFPQYFDLKQIRNTRYDEQRGKCYYCKTPMLREMDYRRGGGQPWYLCTLEHLTDRLDPRRWDKNTDSSPQRYAAACARCNHARSAWNQKHTPKELIDLLSRNPNRRNGREIVTEYYATHEYVPPPPFVPPEIKTCNPPCPEHICKLMASTGFCDYIPEEVKDECTIKD
jgi:hypothetical protein